jgi:hypothetical protein
MAAGLIRPADLKILFKPSDKQYEVWKCLQPECPECGGEIVHVQSGTDRNGNPTYKPVCTNCGNDDIPQIILEGGAAGGGKCLSINSLVCTPFGFRPLKDLKVGDIITNAITGKMQRVIWIHPKGRFPFYRIHFVDGTYTDCSEGHLWRVHQSRKKTKKAKNNPEHYAIYGDDKIMETSAMYRWYQRKKAGMYKGVHLIIPLTAPVEFTTGSRPMKIKPYILGALIGDGCITDLTIGQGHVEMTTMDEEIVQRFKDAGYDMSHRHQKPGNRAADYAIYDKELIDNLKELDIAGNRSQTHFIPKRYLYSSIKERIELMQGLIDTDGYVDDRGHMTYTSTSRQLAEDVAFIVRSLGGVATVTRNQAGYRNKRTGELVRCADAYDVQIRTTMNPDLCGLTRKKERARYEFNGGASKLGKRITDIEYIGEQESFCITVDDPSGLYVTDNFTVTHNSYLGACWLVSCCIRWPNMRMVVGRKTLKSLRDSTWNTICVVVKQWGLKEKVNYKVNNISGEMIFWNDSRIIMKELNFQPSDPSYLRFGSSEYSGVFIDECGELDEKAVDILFSRIRWNIPNTLVVPKMLMSTNPCLGWVRSRFVLDDDGNDVVCRKYERYIPYSVYDNPDPNFRMQYLNGLSRISNKADRERLLYGNWQFVDANEMAAYHNFDGTKHLVDGLSANHYNPMVPLISGWDFNVAPYMSELEIQIDYAAKKVYVLAETLGKPEDKENNTPALAAKVKQKYLSMQHLGGMVITGDPAGTARSTQTKEGVNNYTIIVDNMKNGVLQPKIKLLNKQPPQAVRLDFVNALLNGYRGWQILIDMRCRKLTEDLVYQTKNMDGTKVKKKVTNPKTGGKEEKYGHLSDILDYVLVLFLNDEWKRFQGGGYDSPVISVSNNSHIYTSFEY